MKFPFSKVSAPLCVYYIPSPLPNEGCRSTSSLYLLHHYFSLSVGSFLSGFKHAIMCSILKRKKKALVLTLLALPMPFLYSPLQQIAWLFSCSFSPSCLESIQSGFCPHPSTETALDKVVISMLLNPVVNSHWLSVNSACDKVDHSLLFFFFKVYCGLYFFLNKFIYLFIFGYVGSSLLRTGSL